MKDKRGLIRNSVCIEARPSIVEERQRFGDLEIATIIGKNHKGALVTINDRLTGQLKMKKLGSKNADELAQATLDVLMDRKAYLKTITADNGKEFAAHEKIAKGLNVDFYFAHPYPSWQRGSNENLNGLIRQYIPKKTDLSTLPDTYIQCVEDQINHRPRKRFNFENPQQRFDKMTKKKVAFVT